MIMMSLAKPIVPIDSNPYANVSVSSNSNSGLYNVVYGITKDYYKTSLDLLKESSNPNNSSISSYLVDWLLDATKRFAHYLTHDSKVATIELRSIDRMVKKNTVFGYASYYMGEFKLRTPDIPKDFISSIDRINSISSFMKINDSVRLKRKIKEYIFSKEKDSWLYSLSTPEAMSKYMDDTAPIVIDEGVYLVNYLLPLLKEYLKELITYFNIFKKKIKTKEQELSDLEKNTKKLYSDLNSYSKFHSKEDTELIKNEIDKANKRIANAYTILSVYHRACMIFYAKQYNVLVNTIHAMYSDIDETLKRKSLIPGNLDIDKFIEELK